MTSLYSVTYSTPSGKVVSITEDGRHGFKVAVDGSGLGIGFELCTRTVNGADMTCAKVGSNIVPVPADFVEGLTAAVAARKALAGEVVAGELRYEAQRARIKRGMNA